MRMIELIDGGTGEECQRLGVPDDRRIWSARALVESRYHDIVRQVHERFIAAGSRYTTTANYAVVPGVGLDERISELTAVAAGLARDARDNSSVRGVRVLGSMPPLIESYRPDLVLPRDQAVPLYERIAAALDPVADVFLAETMSSLDEARSAVLGARAVNGNRPIWVSWTLSTAGCLRSGEPVEKAVLSMAGEGVAAVLFNCSEPEAITRALGMIHDAGLVPELHRRGVRLGAYANRLTPVPDDFSLAGSTAPQAMRTDLDVDRYTEFALTWAGFGAELIGGCCGIGPEYIAALKRNVATDSNQQSAVTLGATNYGDN